MEIITANQTKADNPHPPVDGSASLHNTRRHPRDCESRRRRRRQPDVPTTPWQHRDKERDRDRERQTSEQQCFRHTFFTTLKTPVKHETKQRTIGCQAVTC